MKVNLKLLATARREKNISQEEMARNLGYKTRGAYNRVEKGIVKLRMDQVQIIVKTLELTIDEVFDIFFGNEVA